MAILEEETYTRFGYYSGDLSLNTHKKILAACDDCGKIRKIRKRDYRTLCRVCICKGNRCYNYGKSRSEETKQKISEVRKGKCCGKNNLMYGKHHSEETKQKILKNQICLSKENHPNWKGGLIRRNCVECGKVFNIAPSVLKAGNGRFCSKSCGAKASRRHRVFPTKYTKPERIFEDICQRNNLPFKYVGNNKVKIGKKGDCHLNPDFIEKNGKRHIIEIMGGYWHSPLMNLTIPERAKQTFRKKHYRKYGWKSVFIWDTDLLREDAEAFVLSYLAKQKFI